MKILHQILLLVMIPLGVLTSFYLIEINELLSDIEQDGHVELRLKTDAITREFVAEAEEMNTLVGIISSDIEFGAFVEAGDVASLYQRSKRLAALEGFLIIFMDVNGLVISRSHDEFVFGDQLGHVSVIQRVMESNKSVLYVGDLDGTRQIAMLSPLKDTNGNTVAYVVVGKSLDNIVHRLGNDFQVEIYLSQFTLPEQRPQPFATDILYEYEEVSINLPMDETLDVIVLEDFTNKKASLIASRNRILWIAIAFSMVLVFVATLLTRRFTRPIVSLAALMSKNADISKLNSGQGELNEITALTRNFKLMRHELDKRHKALEKSNAQLMEEVERRRLAEEGLEEKVLVRTKELADANLALQAAKDKAEKLSVTDQLTGLCNRLKIDQEINKEINLHARYGNCLSVILIDLDFFKSVNDSFGHLTGDQVLKTFAQVLQAHVRVVDVCARWGGEEFVVLCRETGIDKAVLVAEKIRHALSEQDFPRSIKQTASFGVTSCQAEDTPESLMNRADEALYLAKSKGRNCVEVV